MESKNVTNKKILIKLLFTVNIMVTGFWIVGWNINVYQYKVVGVLFELFWLPSIFCLVAVPVISIYFWFKSQFKNNSFFLYLLIWSILSIVGLYFWVS